MGKDTGLEIAKLFKETRRREGRPLPEIAKEAGCSARILQYWEDGRRVPSDISLISKVLKALGKSYTIGERED